LRTASSSETLTTWHHIPGLKVNVSSPYNLPCRHREGIEVYLYSFFNPTATWGWAVSAMPWPLHAHEGGAVPIPQEAEWDTGPVWTGAENIISTGIWSLDHPAHSKSHTKHATSAHITGLIICECYMLLLSECCTCSSQAIQADHTTTTSNEQKLTELKQHRVTKVCEITNGSSVCSVLTGLVLSSAGSHTYDQFKTWPGHWLVWHSEGSYCFNFDHEDEGSKIFW